MQSSGQGLELELRGGGDWDCLACTRPWVWSPGLPRNLDFLLSPDPCPHQVPNCTYVIYASNKPTTGNLETFFPPWSRPCVVQLNVQFKPVLFISALKTARHPPSNPWIRKPFLEQLFDVLRLQTIKP